MGLCNYNPQRYQTSFNIYKGHWSSGVRHLPNSWGCCAPTLFAQCVVSIHSHWPAGILWVRWRLTCGSESRFSQGGDDCIFSSFANSAGGQQGPWEKIRTTWLYDWLGREEKNVNTALWKKHFTSWCMLEDWISASINQQHLCLVVCTPVRTWHAVSSSNRCLLQCRLWSQCWLDVGVNCAGCCCWFVLTEKAQSQWSFSKDHMSLHGVS